jgi:hypothetical protein
MYCGFPSAAAALHTNLKLNRRNSICLIAVALIGLSVLREAFSKDIYISQAGSGTTNSLAWLNNSANWGPGTSQVTAGDTVHLLGTLTNSLTISGSGGPGSPITIYFEPAAKFSAATWTNNSAIIQSASYITIDGGSNGVVEATANGTGLANSNDITGVYLLNCSGVIVKNLIIQNLYVHTAGDGSGGGNGVSLVGTSVNDSVTNCIFHDMRTGVMIVSYAGCSNITYTHCQAYRCNWGGAAGDANSSGTLNGLSVDHCRFHDWANWDDPADNFHHNGFYAWAESGGCLSNVTYSANYVGPGYGAHNTSGLYISGKIFGAMIYNNVFDATDGTGPADGLIFVYLHSGINTSTVFVCNNTFFGEASASDFYSGFGSNLTTYVVENNEFYSNHWSIVCYMDTDCTFVSDYNNVYTPNNLASLSASQTGSVWEKTFAQWQTVYGYDLHGSTNAPSLDANSVPTLSDSVARGQGTNLSAFFTTDFYGNTRPATGPWTIGAFEVPGTNQPAGGPSVQLKSSSLTITNGGSCALSWTTLNATNLTISGFGSVPLNGTTNVSPRGAMTYTATAFGSGGQDSSTVSIAIAPNPPPHLRVVGADE